MAKKLSEAEHIVIREIFKNPHISLTKIETILKKTGRRVRGKLDVRTVSKFKSTGLKKIKEGLEDLADALRLDRSIQGETKKEIEEEKNRAELLLKNGILSGHDFRIDREVYLFYTVKDQMIFPWQDHLCNRNCEDDCTRILRNVKTDHGLDEPNTQDIRDQFRKTIEDIIEKNKERKKNE